MGTTVVLIALFAEAAFATFCIITRSKQEKTRDYLRVGAFVAFILATLVSILEWSFRWYGLALLLLIWAILGILSLIRSKSNGKGFSISGTVIKAITVIILVFIAVIPALIFPQYTLPPATGDHPVATVNFTYTDQSRMETFTNTGAHREVNVEFWYPTDGGGPYPLILFSHGSFGVKTSNTSTFIDLASNGYVVCSIDHPYHSLYTVDADGNRAIIDQSIIDGVVGSNNGKYDEATAFDLENQWMNLRTTDINFVLDTILAQVRDNNSTVVYRLIDPGKIGLMGHSIGGESAAQVARERSDIGAVVNLDADLHGEYVKYSNGEYVLNATPYPVPLLTILGDDLVRLIDAIPNHDEIIAVQHVTATAPVAFEVHFAGTDHMSFTDVPLISPVLVAVINSSVPKAGGTEVDPYATIEKMNKLVLQFFNVYLKSEGQFTTAGMN